MKLLVGGMIAAAMLLSYRAGAQAGAGAGTGTGARGAPLPRPSDTAAATATLSDSGIVVRFPRSMSPDSITREMPASDLFGGYEWRVVLVSGERALLSALVIAPNDSLVLHRYTTIRAVYMAGDLRNCHRNDLVIECDRLARGLVRDVDGRVEIAVIDSNWLLMAMRAEHPVVRLVVKRNRETLWSADVPLSRH
ncbi:MAG: hypothetical protein ABUL71_05470 [Gemmatimonadota bacterium]